jgi:hypothetical protein
MTDQRCCHNRPPAATTDSVQETAKEGNWLDAFDVTVPVMELWSEVGDGMNR